MGANERAAIEHLDRTLDRLAGAPVAGAGPDSELWSTIKHISELRDLSVGSGPDPVFVERLKASLAGFKPEDRAAPQLHDVLNDREDSVDYAIAQWKEAGLPTSPDGPAKRRPNRSFWGSRTSGRIASLGELALVTSLLLAIVGTAWGRGPFGGLNGVWGPAAQPASDVSGTGMYRGNAARTGVMSGPGPEGVPRLAWKEDYAGEDIVVDGGKAYLLDSKTGDLTVFDVATGAFAWRTKVGLVKGPALAVADGTIYVVVSERAGSQLSTGYLLALAATSAAEKWRYEIPVTLDIAPAVEKGTVFVTSGDDTLRAVDAKTGQERWQFDLTGGKATPVPSLDKTGEPIILSTVSPAIADGVVYAAASADGVLYAIDTESGAERWSFQTDGNYLLTPAVADGTVFLVGATATGDAPPADGKIYAINANDGSKRWVQDQYRDIQASPAMADGLVTTPAVADGKVFLSGNWPMPPNGPGVTALDAKTGELVWQYSGNGATTGAPIYSAGTIYVSSGDSSVVAIDAATGTAKWRVQTTAFSDEIAVADGLVIVPSGLDQTGTVYAIGGGGDAATPTADGTLSVDISGLSPCKPPRDFTANEIPGTPRAIRGSTPGPDLLPQILESDLPQGPPVDEETADGIRVTLKEMCICWTTGHAEDLGGFYTNDFYGRPSTNLDGQLGENPQAWAILVGATPASDFNSAVMLPDGRVGAEFKFEGHGVWYVVFVEQNGRWLIDERLAIAPALG